MLDYGHRGMQRRRQILLRNFMLDYGHRGMQKAQRGTPKMQELLVK